MTDRLLGLFVCLMAIAYGWVGYGYTAGFTDPVGPSFMPMLISVPMFFFSFYLVVRPEPNPAWASGGVLLRQAFSVGALIAYAIALSPVGFLISTAIVLIAGGLISGATPKKSLLLGLIGSPVMYVLFNYLLALPLPKGIFSF